MAYLFMSDSFPAFILTRHWRDTSQGVRVDLWLATDQGPQEIQLLARESVFFVLRRECDKIIALLQQQNYSVNDVRWAEVNLKTPRNLAVNALYFRSHKRLLQAKQLLQGQVLSCWESDIRPPERLLMERSIFAGIEVTPTEVFGVRAKKLYLWWVPELQYQRALTCTIAPPSVSVCKDFWHGYKVLTPIL